MSYIPIKHLPSISRNIQYLVGVNHHRTASHQEATISPITTNRNKYFYILLFFLNLHITFIQLLGVLSVILLFEEGEVHTAIASCLPEVGMLRKLLILGMLKNQEAILF